MNSFLEKIQASEKLLEELSSASLKAFNNVDTNKVRILVKTNKHLSPESNIEFFSKAISKFNEMNIDFDFINFEIEHRNDNIQIYENIRSFISYKNDNFDLSTFITVIENDEVVIKVSKEQSKNIFNEHLKELSNYLGYFSITNYNIKISFTPEELGAKKLEEQINKEIVYEFNKEEVIDETIRNKHSLVDLNKNEKQMKVYFEGFVFGLEERKASTGTMIYSFSLGKEAEAVMVTIFDKQNVGIKIKNGDSIRVYGMYEFDEFSKGNILKAFSPAAIQKISYLTLNNIKTEDEVYDRSEFHIHTKMSTLDGVSEVNEYVKYAEAYGLKGITITDHNSVQAFPDASAMAKKTDVKINYGVEFDVYDDLTTQIVINEREQNLVDAEYVFFDLETTNLSAATGEIIEFGAVKFKDNKVIDKLQLFIKPEEKISEFTTSLTSITNEDVVNAPKIHEAIDKIRDWIGDSILVAHNASFDFNFLNKAYVDHGYEPIHNPVIDTMKISWFIHPSSRGHRLGVLAKHEFVPYDENAAHRADYDAEVLASVYERLLHKLLSENIRTLIDLNSKSNQLKDFYFTKHITLISKNQNGLKSLNKLVSMASIDFFNKKKKNPMLPLSLFFEKGELFSDLLIGSACERGFLFQAILDADELFIETIISMYDYLEIFAPTSYKHLLVNNDLKEKELHQVIRKIVELGKKHNIPVIASSNAHYASETEKKFRDILISAPKVGGGYHTLFSFRNPKSEKPDSHLRRSSELIKEFSSFLTKEDVMDVVVNNTKTLQEQISEQDPIKNKLFTPKINDVEERLKKLIDDNVLRLYGENPDEKIIKRINRELDSILKHGFGIIYYLSSVAVKKSLDDGYLVGSRGSVGSSIVATLTDITEVNPLEPHYRCEKCKYHEFSDEADTGYDLPQKKCPVCGHELTGDGHNIPFETFLGFNADKVPDIDLNFSRDNQSDIHLFMKEFLGEDNVYRAGTISTAAFKTAIGYTKKYEEINEINFNKATTEWLSNNIQGAKRTTGQHPGGLIVIPNDMEVYDFTAINYPGDDPESDWKTTHFDFHSIHDNLLKLDLLGHLDPSMIRMLQNLTGVDPKDIPMNDKEVISLFDTNKYLKFIQNYTGEELGIIGLPEFGTNFVRRLVKEAKPKSFADLVRISGLSHGTDVWTGNAQTLIKENKAVLSEVISVRDDIMGYLIGKGLDNSTSFNIMESVRKGKGLTDEWEQVMRANNVPEWYIESCKAIKYMFPKAHATAYVIMAYRIAWWKINYPLEYYATFFSKRDIEIELGPILKGIDSINKHINEIKSKPRNERVKKDDDLLETYNIILEMYSRGIEFSNIDINKSRSANFIIDKDNNKIIPPFSVLDSIGVSVAENATNVRREKKYESQADFERRVTFPKKVIAKMEELKVFDGLDKINKSNLQLSLFD